MKYSEDLKLVGFSWFILCDLPGSALLSCRAVSPIPWGSSLSCCSQAQGKHSWHRAQLAKGTAGCGICLVSLQLQFTEVVFHPFLELMYWETLSFFAVGEDFSHFLCCCDS